MNLDSFTGPGSTPSRRRFWDKVTAAVIASQKIAGDNVTVVEYQGDGTIINIAGNRGRLGPNQGACCDEENNCTIATEETCTGTFQGVGTVCDPNPCGEGTTGACCTDGECSILSAADCATDGGIYQGNGTLCSPNPCAIDCCFPTGGDICNPGDTLCLPGESCSSTDEASCISGSGRVVDDCSLCNLGPPQCCDSSNPICCYPFGDTELACCNEGENCCPGFGCSPDPCGGMSPFDDPFFQNN